MRQAVHLVAENEKCVALRSKTPIVSRERILLNANYLPAGAFELRGKMRRRGNALPCDIRLRTECRLSDLFVYAPETIRWPRRVPTEIELGNTRRVSRAENGAHVVCTPNVVKKNRDLSHVSHDSRMLYFRHAFCVPRNSLPLSFRRDHSAHRSRHRLSLCGMDTLQSA